MIISNELILHDMMNSQDKLTHPAVIDELARALIYVSHTLSHYCYRLIVMQ
jgi:hypothetical protein